MCSATVNLNVFWNIVALFFATYEPACNNVDSKPQKNGINETTV